MTMLKAPWTPAQTRQLNAWQRADCVHPFTCAARGDGRHGELHGDMGTLVASPLGWICPWCDGTQDWAHDYMADAEALQHLKDGLALLHKQVIGRKHPEPQTGATLTVEVYGIPGRVFEATVIGVDEHGHATIHLNNPDAGSVFPDVLHYDDYAIVEEAP